MMDQWIKDEIMIGLEKSFNFGFLGEPKNIKATAEVWFEVFSKTCKDWTPERDAGRILKAFSDFFTNGKRFPLPSNIIELLPKRDPQLALPRPEITDEERMTARKYLALWQFQCANSDFRVAYADALKNKSEHEKSLDIARRVIESDDNLKSQAVAFFKHYNEDLIKRFD